MASTSRVTLDASHKIARDLYVRRTAHRVLQRPVYSRVSHGEYPQSSVIQDDPLTWPRGKLLDALRLSPLHNLETARTLVRDVWRLHERPGVDIVDIVPGFGTLTRACLELDNVNKVYSLVGAGSMNYGGFEDHERLVRIPQMPSHEAMSVVLPDASDLGQDVFCLLHMPRSALSRRTAAETFYMKYAMGSLLKIALRVPSFHIAYLDMQHIVRLFEKLTLEENQVVSPYRFVPIAQMFYKGVSGVHALEEPISDHIFSRLAKNEMFTTKRPSRYATMVFSPVDAQVDPELAQMAYALATQMTTRASLSPSWRSQIRAISPSSDLSVVEGLAEFDANPLVPPHLLTCEQWLALAKGLYGDVKRWMQRESLDLAMGL